MTLNVQDRAGNAVALKTQLSSASEHVSSTAITDAGANNQAAVASYAGNANTAISGNALQVGAIPLISNPAGNVDALKKGGSDLMPMRGLLPVSAMCGTRYTATSTSSVSATTASATLSVANTTGFKVGGVCNLEPGTTRYEAAEITAVVANTSVSVTFPSGGALYTHTANYTIETFDASVIREAPGRYGAAYVSSDGPKPTYRAGAVGQTLYSTASAVLLEIQGSATATLRVKRIELWAQAPSANYTELQMLRCTGLSGSGTPTAANNGLHDTNDAAASGVVNFYTAAATSGAGHLVIGAKPMTCVKPASTAGIGPSAIWDFSRNQDKAMVLRGTGDVVEIYNTITGLGSGTFGFEVEWEEDNS